MNKELNIKMIIKVLGGLLLIEAGFLLLPILVALVYSEFSSIQYYFITIAFAVVLGVSGLLYGRNAET